MKGELYPFYFKHNNFRITFQFLLWKLWNKFTRLDFSFYTLTLMAFILYKVLCPVFKYLFFVKEVELWSWEQSYQDQLGPPSEMLIRPFKVNVRGGILDGLKVRLEETRFENSIPGSEFDYGFNSIYLGKVIKYWTTRYDWRREEVKLNRYPQFLTRIDDLDVHFIHVKPTLSEERKVKVIPLLLVHGFPGSAANFMQLIPMLTSAHPSEDFVFEVIAPSVPGFGFSESPHQKELSGKDVAKMFIILMDRLERREFFVMGCGWGSVVASLLGRFYPSRVKGVHVNKSFFLPTSLDSMLRLLLMYFFPVFFSETERRFVSDVKDKVNLHLRESGFHHLIVTKPNRLGNALADSPAGLAAFLVEEFLKGKLVDSEVTAADRKVHGEATMDDLLTLVTSCWINNNFTASARFLKTIAGELRSGPDKRVPLTVPVGISAFPDEALMVPKLLLEEQIGDLVSYSIMPRGGYMACMEEPALLARDFVKFVKIVESRKFKGIFSK